MVKLLFLILTLSSYKTYSVETNEATFLATCRESGNCINILNKASVDLSVVTLNAIKLLNKKLQKQVQVAKSIELIDSVYLSEEAHFLVENFKRITNQCQKLINQVPFDLLFSEIDPCAIIDFTRLATWKRHVHVSDSERLSIDSLKDLADQITRKDRFKKYQIPDGRRKQLEVSLNTLVRKMELSNIDSISLSSIALFAEDQLAKNKKAEKVGGCYIIESKKGFMLPYREYVPVSSESQKALERLFTSDVQIKGLSKNEQKAISSNRLSKEEIKELRAIRKATEVFEKSTFLKDDEAGGTWSNLKGELFGGGQQNCVDEEITYRHFLKSLAKQGLLKHFYPGSRITKEMSLKNDWGQSGHVAGTLINKRTGERLVIDSWYEPGGSPAHIQTREDWLKTPISYFGKLDFNDVVKVGN